LIKKLLTVLLIITAATTLGFIYLKIFVQPPFGPLGLVLLSLLTLLSIFLLFSLHLYNSARRQTLAKIWMSLFAIFLTYLISELTLSLLFVKRLSPTIIQDRYRHHKLAPNTISKIDSEENRYVQRVNNIGTRGRDVELNSAHTNLRILMLGDSFTMGKGVADDKTFSALLENSLRKQNKNVEVLNAGVDSYAPILSYLQLTGDLKGLHPDLVVLNLDMSDLLQESAYRKNATYNEQGEILRIEGRLRLTLRIMRWINKNLYISRFIIFNLNKTSKKDAISIENVTAQANKELLKHTLAEDTEDRTEQWNNIFDSILKIKKYCAGHNCEFLLTIYPWGHQVSDAEWVEGRSVFLPEKFHISDRSLDRVIDFSRNNKVQLLNLFPAFRSYKGNSKLYYSRDMHLTETGHKLVAQELEKWFMVHHKDKKPLW
jgi:lysophospholipase L1-like esterase